MKHTINLAKYNIRTDMILDEIDKLDSDSIIHNTKKVDNIIIDDVEVKGDIKRKKGIYKTITFDDVTDKDNFKLVEKVVSDELKNLLDNMNITSDMSALIVGLGNKNSTPDSLGPKVCDNVLVTGHLFSLGEVDDGYRRTYSFTPGVSASTGIETRDLVKAVAVDTKASFLIVIDSLASSSITRLNKTIQITNTGIAPGSGVLNDRKTIDNESLGIPVIVIGIPTILDAATIVNDVFKCMKKNFSYKKDKLKTKSSKFINPMTANYLKTENNLTKEETNKIFGMIGNLSDDDIKRLIIEVLSPINYNLMVTPKEIDFLIEKFSLLLAQAINSALHDKI